MKLIAPIAVMIAAATAGRIYNHKLHSSFANPVENHKSGAETRQRRQYSGYSEAYEKPHIHSSYKEDSSVEKDAKILGYHIEQDGHSYKFGYETDNGIRAEEIADTTHGTSAHGAYSYKGDDGKIYTVTYIADEHGFRPIGDHLPTAPPVPEEILKSMELNAHAEAHGIFDDGKYLEHKLEEHEHHQEHHHGKHHDHHQEHHQEHHTEHHKDHHHGLHEHHHYEAGHHFDSGEQSSFSTSGADLAYHAHTPSHHSAGETSTSFSQQPSFEYYMPNGHTESNTDYSSHHVSGHVLSDSGYSQGSSGFESKLHTSFLPAVENTGLNYAESSKHTRGRSYLPPSRKSKRHHN